ncbi:11588_t:CDS:2, partial [Funneliformis mosseae]
ILNNFFVSSCNASMRVWDQCIVDIARPPVTGTTEDSYHAFWDALIIKPMLIGCPEAVYNRNTSKYKSTGLCRPDTSCLISGACLVRGEEKGPENSEDPAKELTSKMKWTYGDCPYIFGYYAIATKVTYCYLQEHWPTILPLLRQNIPESFQEEFDVLYRSRSSKVIQLKHDSVVKYYSTPDLVLNIVELYHEMAEHAVPYIDSVLQHNVTEGTIPYIIFTPRGVLYKPRTINELIKAIYCVLTAIKVSIIIYYPFTPEILLTKIIHSQSLHKMNIMHRDLRWENVMKYIDSEKWFIIDFEDACKFPSRVPNTQLAKESHAPEVSQSYHDDSVDVWSVGYLIQTASVKLGEPDKLKDYVVTQLMANDEYDRPTSGEALEWLWKNYKEILSEDFLEPTKIF